MWVFLVRFVFTELFLSVFIPSALYLSIVIVIALFVCLVVFFIYVLVSFDSSSSLRVMSLFR